MAAELSGILHRIRLHDYLPVLQQNGFDTWDIVCDISEDDMAHLGFKLGHRRILQREIAASRGAQSRASLASDSTDRSPHTTTTTTPEDASTSPPQAEERKKRRYRRKPRPDINAPKKPKTAYVNFADTLRTDPAINSQSFVEIAREVGRRWQALPPEQKHVWECQAARDMQEYEAQMDEYKTTENYRRYQNYLKSFNHAQSQPKRPSLDHDRKSRSNSSETLSNGTGEAAPRPELGPRKYDECHVAFELAMQELSVRRDEVMAEGVPRFDVHHLPPQDRLRKAAMSCRVGTGSFFFLVREEHLQQMLDHVYSHETIEPFPLMVVLLLAAIGAHYDVDCMTDTERHGLFVSAAFIFESELAGVIDYRSLWIFTMLSIHSILEKHMVARHVVAAGLQISRYKEPEEADESGAVTVQDAHRLICTLIFVECWLSTTLGYKADVRADDITRAWPRLMQSTSISDAIYIQGCKIGLVSREIAEVTIHKAASAVRTEHIELLTEQLDTWHRSLPATMHLAALADEQQSSCLTPYQRRAILMIHMFYLGAIISLYRQLLLQACEARIHSKWNLDMPYSQIQSYRTRCSIAAQQMTRMMQLISWNGAMTKRCWVMIHWAFQTCTVILFGIGLQMMDQHPATIEEDFAYAKVCADTLGACSTAEPVAAKYLAVIKPLYEALVDKRQRLQYEKADEEFRRSSAPLSTAQSHVELPGVSSQPHPAAEPRDEEIISIVKKLSELLADPFSLGLKAKIQGVRETSNGVGTYSVLWWK
ncbi:High mobility group protein 20A [Lasiodiplodia hormozganensis]|uniref:High mobility group protein 20A n=1 Tax=Lasiodiplodia hormozganensis TaxID=869390 RepID=A0AA39YY46_9PEZI|nr:High mobility group protein 20A [Lasiodiplodia hormozganensis]